MQSIWTWLMPILVALAGMFGGELLGFGADCDHDADPPIVEVADD